MRILRNLGKSVNIFLQKIGRVTKFTILIFSNLILGSLVYAFLIPSESGAYPQVLSKFN